MNLEECDSALREFALRYPEAWEDFPWGERVIKVRKKVFAFLGIILEGKLRICVKLPESAQGALALPFTEVAGYGLGRAGWVNAWFEPGDEPPMDLLGEWIDESYRAIAPRMLVNRLPPLGTLPGPLQSPRPAER